VCLHQVHQRSQRFQTLDPEKKSAFTSRDMIFDENSMLQEKSKMEDKAQGGDSPAADTQKKRVEFSDSPKRLEVSEEDSSDSDEDKHESTQEQPKSLRRSVRVTVAPLRYGWEKDHISFTLVKETGEPDSYREAVDSDNHDKWITAME